MAIGERAHPTKENLIHQTTCHLLAICFPCSPLNHSHPIHMFPVGLQWKALRHDICCHFGCWKVGGMDSVVLTGISDKVHQEKKFPYGRKYCFATHRTLWTRAGKVLAFLTQ